MNDLPRQKLCEIIACYGQSVCDDPKRCEGLLRDFCRGEHRREISVLIGALKEQVPLKLMSSHNSLPRELLLPRLTRQLQDNLALSDDAAIWAVESWALALGVISSAEYETSRPKVAVPLRESTSEGTKQTTPSATRLSSTPPVVSTSPAAASPPPTLTSPHPVQTSSRPPSGLKNWQKAAIIGSLSGVAVVIGFFSTNSPPSVVTQPEPSTSLSVTPSPSESQVKETLVPTPSAPVPGQVPYFPQTASISQQEAVNLIAAWLKAKQVMFAPPYSREPATELTTGEQYVKTAGPNGSIDWLENNNAYYKYGVQNIDGVDRFVTNGNQATIQVRVSEDRTLYKNGNIDRNETDFKTRTARYNLQLVDGQWKIADLQIFN